MFAHDIVPSSFEWVYAQTADKKLIDVSSLWLRPQPPGGAVDHYIKANRGRWRAERLHGSWQGLCLCLCLSARHHQPSLTTTLLSTQVPAHCSQPRPAGRTQRVMPSIWYTAAVVLVILKHMITISFNRIQLYNKFSISPCPLIYNCIAWNEIKSIILMDERRMNAPNVSRGNILNLLYIIFALMGQFHSCQ